jgi:hypothetical protein
MKIGTSVGFVFAVAGIVAGLYFSVSPVLETFLSGQVNGQVAGMQFAMIGTIIGLSCASIGFIFYRATTNT